MSDGRPVARLVSPMVRRLGLVVGAIAAIAVGFMALTAYAVHHLNATLSPAAAANARVMQDVVDMESGIRAYGLGHDPQRLESYRQALRRLPEDQTLATRAASDSSLLGVALARQSATIRRWQSEYAEPRLARSAGPGGADAALFAHGQDLMTAVRAAHLDTTRLFVEQVDAQDRRAQIRLVVGTGLIGVLALVGLVLLRRARRTLLYELSEPLLDLEAVVALAATSEGAGARAVPRGPREVRAVAVAFNELAQAQRRAREAEAKVQGELREVDRAKTEFLSIVSHEFRTPLTTINGYLELIGDEFEGRMAPRHEQMLAAAGRSVDRLRDLIDSLLTLSRAEDLELPFTEVALCPLLAEVVDEADLAASRRDVVVRFAGPRLQVSVAGDRHALHRALANIVGNAVKFSHDRGAVTVRITASDSEVRIEVQDRGVGIPAADLPRLGERFFRAPNAVQREIPGTGLGLRIVQTVLDKHQGRLEIESREGEGTTVALVLPRWAAALDTPTVPLLVADAAPSLAALLRVEAEEHG